MGTLHFRDTAARGLRGSLHLRVQRGSNIIEEWQDHNLITDLARPRIRDIMSGEMTNAHITHIGVGEGRHAPLPTDTGLTNCVLVPFSGIAKPDATTARFMFIIDPSTANGLSITEFGLFTGDGVLFSKRVRDRVIEKDADMSIFGYWDIFF